MHLWRQGGVGIVLCVLTVAAPAEPAAAPDAAEQQHQARSASARSTLATVNSLLELYKTQHGGALPGPDLWSALTQKTNAAGTVDPAGTLGPYLDRAPANPWTGLTRVGTTLPPEKDDGWTWDMETNRLKVIVPLHRLSEVRNLSLKDFEVNLVEKPRAEHVNALTSSAVTLRLIHTMLTLYHIQHNDRYPTMAQMKGWSALLWKSDAAGELSARAPFGPYAQSAPENPCSRNTAIAPAGQATADDGWSYDETSGVVRIVLTKEQAPAWISLFGRDHLEIAR